MSSASQPLAVVLPDQPIVPVLHQWQLPDDQVKNALSKLNRQQRQVIRQLLDSYDRLEELDGS